MLRHAEELLRARVRDVPDFPKPGIVFRDITPLLGDASALSTAIEEMCADLSRCAPDKIVGIEARGFILGAPAAYHMATGFVPVRKSGKLPHETHAESFALEYGEETLEIHRDAIAPGERVAIVDDVLATGGTARATAHLVERAGGTVVGLAFLIELEFLKGRARLTDYEVLSLLKY